MKTHPLPSLLSALLLLSILPYPATAADPWPAESFAQAIDLTSLDADLEIELSGACWNETTRTLWVCRNGPNSLTSKLWSIIEDGMGGFVVDQEWTGFGDLECVTQADLTEEVVYLMDENDGRIKEYNVSMAVASLQNDWNTSALLAELPNGDGAEGITFVPDCFLGGFVDANGNPYTSVNGMGGLMFVCHQDLGEIYVFDLDRNNTTFAVVGEYRTAFDETAALEFDRSTGLLYAYHDTNYDVITVMDLTSVPVGGQTYRQFNVVACYDGPTTGNNEGIAIAPITDCDLGARNFFLTEDHSVAGQIALTRYRRFTPDCPPPDCLAGTVNASSGTVEDVFLVDGSAGNANREVFTTTNTPIDLEFQASSAGSGAGRYWLWVWTSAPGGGAFFLNPSGQTLGCYALPTPFHGAGPQPFRCLMGGVPAAVCAGVPVVAPPGTGSVPWMLTLPGGVANPVTLTFQGGVEDVGSNHPLGFSVANGVVLHVQ